jgi:hypothetical protein
MREIETPVHPSAHVCGPSAGQTVGDVDGRLWFIIYCYHCGRFLGCEEFSWPPVS